MARYDAILFDFDGVIADSEPVHYASWAEALRPLGVTFDWQTYHTHAIGLADREMLRNLARRSGRPVSLERLWERYPAKQQIFLERMLREPPISSETATLIQSLAESGWKLGLVTSTARAEVEPVLGRAGIARFFQAAVYGEDVTAHKPDPEPYALAAKRLVAQRALVVEDSDAGEASGRAAGFDVLRIPDARQTPALVRAKLEA